MISYTYIFTTVTKGRLEHIDRQKIKKIKMKKDEKIFITLTLPNLNPFGWVWKIEFKIIHFNF